MIQATTTYLELVNDVIEEAGDDLASFAVDGSDFTTTTDAMMLRMKKWVMRAWRDIQQESLDWEWMSEQAVVNITPGIMFYSPHKINWDVTAVNPVVIFDTNDQPYTVGLEASSVKDLTGVYTYQENFGYINAMYSDYTAEGGHVLDFGMKAGGEYFNAALPITYTMTGLDSDLTATIAEGTVVAEYIITINGVLQPPCIDPASTILGNANDNGIRVLTFSMIPGEFTSGPFEEILALQGGGNYEPWQVVMLDSDGNVLETIISTGTNILLEQNQNVEPAVFPIRIALQGTGVSHTNGGPTVGMSITTVTVNSVDFPNTGVVTAVVDSTSVEFELTSQDAYDAIFAMSQTAENWDIILTHASTDVVLSNRGTIGESAEISTFDNVDVDTSSFKNYIHSWKSFDWAEEIDDDDFVELVREVNNNTFRIISHEQPNIAPESQLTFVAWDEFVGRYDMASIVPAVPRMITEDEQGRWRLYPPPDRPYTIIFTFIREPQIFSAFDDVPRGLPEEFRDLIMWRAISYYGEYAEQPSVAARAWKNYKTMLMKFEMQTRPKFHFKPQRTW